MALSVQPPFPGVPASQSLFEWLDAWKLEHYPGVDVFPKGARELMFEDLPRRYLPAAQERDWAWFRDKIRGWMSTRGLVFPGLREGDEIAVQNTLPLEDFAALQIGRLRLAAGDVVKVRVATQSYAAANPLYHLNVDTKITEWKQAAGL